MRSEIILLNEIVSQEGVHSHCNSDDPQREGNWNLKFYDDYQYNFSCLFKSAWKNSTDQVETTWKFEESETRLLNVRMHKICFSFYSVSHTRAQHSLTVVTPEIKTLEITLCDPV